MTTALSMQAAVLENYGAPFRLASIARPLPQRGQVLVRIMASGVNPLDLKIHGGAAEHARHPLPAILGIDMAGVVVAVGSGVDGFAADDEVFGMTGGVGGVQGALAQFAVVDPALLAHRPKSLTAREAAALPLVFITAWEGLVDRARVAPGKTVLIHGGAGGIEFADAGAVGVLLDPQAMAEQVAQAGLHLVVGGQRTVGVRAHLLGQDDQHVAQALHAGAAVEQLRLERIGAVEQQAGGAHAPAPVVLPVPDRQNQQ